MNVDKGSVSGVGDSSDANADIIETKQSLKGIYAGFWRRLLASIIDFFAMSLCQVIAMGILLGLGYVVLLLARADTKAFEGIAYVTPYLIYLPILWLYFTVMESSATRATFGKMAMGIIVTDSHYRQISFGRANARFWSKALSLYSLLIGFVMTAFTKRKQGLHDIIGGTLVIKKQYEKLLLDLSPQV